MIPPYPYINSFSKPRGAAAGLFFCGLDDVATLREIERRQIDEHQASLERQKALLEDCRGGGAMPRPEGAPKECHRHNSIERVVETK